MSHLTIDIVSILIEEIRKSDLSVFAIAKKSGVHEATIRGWVTKKCVPSVEKAQYVLSVLGKELRVTEKVEEDAEQETKDNL